MRPWGSIPRHSKGRKEAKREERREGAWWEEKMLGIDYLRQLALN